MLKKDLNLNQKTSLAYLALQIGSSDRYLTIFKRPLAETFNLTSQQLIEVTTILYGYFIMLLKYKNNGLPRSKVQKLAGILVNNPPGSRQIRQEEESKQHIPKVIFLPVETILVGSRQKI